MLLVWRMRTDIEVQKTKAIVQAVLAAASEGDVASANKQVMTAWDQYLDEAYPFKRGSRINADQAAMEYLKKEAARGPLKVIPLQPLAKGRSKIRARAKRGDK